ncbi:hypothetical protein AK812_SmicGene15139 [Symbiodinium microadriaticum]|uniref:Uncharacterized protein n=1 Tax=Symbiodinium microadriaticum TaxID=2951 RepID=A0A1Q9E3R7_SYMMI|nr:hypothetical protein AK812_SmicGene15139 [Symbiodinium microadriaticum]
MGGKRGWGGGGGHSTSSGDANSSWNYWKGTWSPRNAKNAEARYDQVERRQDPHTVTGLQDAGTGRTAFLQALQKAVSAAKKHDVKLRKINEERASRQKLWKQYAEDTKRTFAKQKREFEAGRERQTGQDGFLLCSCRDHPAPPHRRP